MKYIKYFSIILFTLFRKVFGLFWYFIAIKYRSSARNIVYNYTLKNGLWLKRLYERDITETEGFYFIGSKGSIKKQDVSTLKYLFWYWVVWVWVDDDSNYDTVDKGFLEKVATGDHLPILGYPFRSHVKFVVSILETTPFGNTFDLGDTRNNNPFYDKVSGWLWNVRNTAYNAKYSMYETVDKEDVFLFTIKSKKFGWEPEDIVDNKQNYTLKFWEE